MLFICVAEYVGIHLLSHYTNYYNSYFLGYVFCIIPIYSFNINITQVMGHHNAHLDPLGINSVLFEDVPACSEILDVGESQPMALC